MSILVFDVVSFVAGVAAGALTAGLAGLLHALEKTADIQEKVLMAKRKADQLTSMLSTSGAANSGISKPEVDELQRDLDEIQAEIKRMYKKTKH